MDKLPTLENTDNGKNLETKTTQITHSAQDIIKELPTAPSANKTKSKRYKLQRSTDNFDDHHCESFLDSHPTELTEFRESVMGGGFATPPPTYCKQYLQNAVTTTAILTNLSNNEQNCVTDEIVTNNLIQMHEKLLDNDGCDKNPTAKEKTEIKKSKPHKESKFAEKLRRSFRRAEHKSLEIKRQDKKETGDLTAAQERSSSLRPLQQQLKNSASIFSLTNLPGLGGHINPALLLDSPDESTPPEFAYRHLSSVATTNSSTSLESNFCESPTTSISYWAWHINNNNMGGELSTTTNTNTTTQANRGSNTAATNEPRKRLEQQSSSKSDYDHPPVTTASRSCSTASESSTAAKLTRLQNFLFKSSNESSRSIQGHSNEGFTVSSNNSTSGEWENLCNFPSTSNNLQTNDEALQLPIDNDPPQQAKLPATEYLNDSNGSLRNYYQYTLASPNNPFLPEITARTYHNTYEEEDEERELEDELDSNVTSVKYRIGTHSAQLPTPNYSRTGSQESTHSECGANNAESSNLQPNIQTQSLYSYSSTFATPGKHKRKLFSLSTPTKLNSPQSQHHPQQQQHLQQANSPSSKSIITPADNTNYHKNIIKTSSCNLVRSLNPFLPFTTVTSSSPPQRTTSSSSLNKRTGPFKQQAVTSPIAIPPANHLKDINAKREEFLRATMQICLVVSPPSSRLQVI